MDWGSHSEKEMIRGKVIFEISLKNDVHNNYETDYSRSYNYTSLCYELTTSLLLDILLLLLAVVVVQ